MARKFTTPNQRSSKLYQVTLDKNLKYEDLEKIANGLTIDEHRVYVEEVTYIEDQPKSEIGIKMKTANVKIVPFNEKNIEKLLALYDDEAKHFSPKLKIRQPETKGLIEGKNAMYSWWKETFEKLPSLHYKVTSLTANTDRVFMEYIRQVDNEEDMAIAEVLEIRE
ncbi:predicted protein, partial [Nematostella vectensis]